VAASGCCGSSPAWPRCWLRSRAVIPGSASPAQPQLGLGTPRHCRPRMLLGSAFGVCPAPRSPQPVAGLSCSQRGGCQGQRPQQGESRSKRPPPSPPPKQLKMKHTQLHNSARIRSRHARRRHPRPPPPALGTPPDLPSIPGVHPLPRTNWCVGMQEKARSSALPPHGGDALGKTTARGTGCSLARPAPAALRCAGMAQGYNGRGNARDDSGAGGGGGSDLIFFSKALTKDTDWEQTKHGSTASARQKQKPWETPRRAGAHGQTPSLGEGDVSSKTGSVLGAATEPGGCREGWGGCWGRGGRGAGGTSTHPLSERAEPCPQLAMPQRD